MYVSNKTPSFSVSNTTPSFSINFVFDRMEVTRPFNGPVLLLEEDHYVTEDFIYVLLKMYRMKQNECKDCTIFTIGLYVKKLSYGSESAQVETVFWQSTKHNMGMSFNRDVWELIKTCSKAFCEFDDYNWDWSLQFITMTCMKQRLKVMTVKSPRVHHIGECGIHHKGKNCDPAVKVLQIENLLKASMANLFPQQLVVTGDRAAPKRLPKQNGGWGDIRDHQLCQSFISTPSR
ncbi:Alpha-1,6-mannosyl-glycoprotein 2-beta-N-acetylglucosaminyltransferase [Lamellibrachia satsuma]|nr:Alpha-1,6-mannosyl-glycoprotein 2-beta-N-acetylglucosaminyltransferase [Lamellibrachia satsuma]